MSVGLGVMINMLGGSDESHAAVQASIGKTIARASLDLSGDGALDLTFTDGTALRLQDDGRSCCESRYITCDDDLTSFVGDTLTSVEIAEGPETTVGEYDETHEQQFLKVRTNRGVITACTHNEHNGYYGGFWIKAVLS